MNISKRTRRELDEQNVNDLLISSETLENIQLDDYTM